ncbi:flagellar export protein FliJ [Bacillus sp. AP8]|uniref:flagellar export protein FliJ n=2 Tax=Bacillus TaxID=1386 RepID=UPI0002EE8757
MMNYHFKFEKILTIREKEKQDIHSKYNRAVKNFEQVAEKLYKLLKKKETLQSFQQEKLAEGLSVLDLRHHQSFMDSLEKMITQCQKDVIQARERMNALQNILIEKNMEVKKFEKIKEKDYEKHVQLMKVHENNQMDDISIQSFLSKEN